MSNENGPSKESLREVKREYKERRKAEQRRAKDADAYWAAQTGRPRRGRRGTVAAIVGLTAVAVAVAGGAAVARIGPFASTGTTTASAASPSAEPASPSAAATPVGSSPGASPSATPTDPALALPFVGTPAEHWASGATGLVAPAAARIGTYRTGQVKAAYAMTVRYLSKALLDPGVNFKGEMKQVLAALGPGFPSYAAKQHALWVKTHGAQGFGWVDLANRFHPGDWKAASQLRAKGRIGKAVIKGSYLQVPFVFTTAYWVRPAKGGAARAIAVRRSGYLQFQGYGPNGVWLHRWQTGYTSSAALCGATWPYPDYLEAWQNLDISPPDSGASPKPTFDLSDPDAPEPDGCFIDTSGFR